MHYHKLIMDALTCINTRYSCRSFRSDPVPRELLEQLIDAGRRAPSARKEEPIDFIIVTDPSTRAYIAELTNYGKFIAEAGACIVVVSKETPYYLEDGCIAAENILLAATALGLQSCWVAGDKKPYANDIVVKLSAPIGHKLIALLAVGYAQIPGHQPQRRPLDRVLHWDKW